MAYLAGLNINNDGVLIVSKAGVATSATQTNTIPYSIGDKALGGTVIYTWSGGTHGYVASSIEVDAPTLDLYWQWPSSVSAVTSGFTVGTGAANTLAMVQHGDCPLADYVTGLTTGGYSDWYIPSKDELTLVYNSKAYLTEIPSGTRYYFSSTDASPETDIYPEYIWRIEMSTGQWWINPKWEQLYVKPIRTF